MHQLQGAVQRAPVAHTPPGARDDGGAAPHALHRVHQRTLVPDVGACRRAARPPLQEGYHKRRCALHGRDGGMPRTQRLAAPPERLQPAYADAAPCAHPPPRRLHHQRRSSQLRSARAHGGEHQLHHDAPQQAAAVHAYQQRYRAGAHLHPPLHAAVRFAHPPCAPRVCNGGARRIPLRHGDGDAGATDGRCCTPPDLMSRLPGGSQPCTPQHGAHQVAAHQPLHHGGSQRARVRRANVRRMRRQGP